VYELRTRLGHREKCAIVTCVVSLANKQDPFKSEVTLLWETLAETQPDLSQLEEIGQVKVLLSRIQWLNCFFIFTCPIVSTGNSVGHIFALSLSNTPTTQSAVDGCFGLHSLEKH
jgi:hypothetical protein